MANSVWVTWPALTKFGSLGVVAGLLVLASERESLFENNLFDFEKYDEYNTQIVCDERSLTARMEDGTCNILDNPAEGSVFRRFGRNVEFQSGFQETEDDTLLSPNPRDVSNSLMGRDEFKPATSVNFIAASWIQFMVHDWVSHGENDAENPIVVPLPAGDELGSGTLEIRRTQSDSTRTADEDGYPVSYRNANTHWWDGSQIYGSNKETSDSIRSFDGGRLKLNDNNTLPTEFMSGVPITGFNENWWVGLSMLHNVFVNEHNAIADMLVNNYPNQSDQWLFDKARLINAALMAKIHTVEWTPAIIANPVTEKAMYANWWGLLGDREGRDQIQALAENLAEDLDKTDSFVKRVLGFSPEFKDKLDDAAFIEHALGGLVGSREPDNAGTAYSLTEEFVSVYRMHPLLRDNIEVYDIGANMLSDSIAIEDTTEGDAEDVMASEGADRLWYSFGITHPGSLTLKNYPQFLRNLSVPLVGDIDLATIDIVRDRERGVPRYNEFRRQIGLNPINAFEDLTADAVLLAELKRLYDNDVEKIDALVGQLAETVRPEGFAFGETAFQIFIMNASRRLITDRFYTTDYTDEVYTAEGIDWVENNTMVDVIRRHNPSLAGSLVGVDNAFKPWGLNMPDDYDSWAGCEKEQHLWVNGAMRTEFAVDELPSLEKIDVLGLISRVLWDKVNDEKDVTPPGYTKPLHAHGVMAKVDFVAEEGSPYTGMFEGAGCGLLRLSVTGSPDDRGFAPGLAWKLFVDGKPSQNVSALYTLSGQGDNYDFFANEMSQYVSPELNETLGTSAIFSAVTSKPTRLMVNSMSEVKQSGDVVASAKAPTQIYFVPSEGVTGEFATSAHDFREDLISIPSGTKIYDVYATTKKIKYSIFNWLNSRYANERRSSAEKIGEIRLDSAFTASAFGDSGVFFKHQRYEDR
ncbi:peroxidase [Gammaproteobacteria bacterium 45_16_T64]|nr:peroxidase [Gammaproteobacteria bacterium 45_16_T64]